MPKEEKEVEKNDFVDAVRTVFDEKDAEIKQHIEDIAGPALAEKAAEIVKEARLRDLKDGVTSLGAEEKIAFVKDLAALSSGEKAAYLTINDQTGGYLIPTEVHNEIMRIGETTGLVARDAYRFPSANIEIPTYTAAAMQGSFVGEDEAADESQNDIGICRLKGAEWNVILRISNRLIRKANVKVAEWLMAIVAEGLAYRIDREGFVGGTFAGSPFVGMLGSDNVTTQTLGSGLTGFEDLTPEEASIAIGTLPTAALANGAFYFHRTVWAKIRTQKDTTSGEYVFKQDNAAIASLRREYGIQPVGEILGYPVFTTDVLPANSASAVSTKFGVFANLKLALAIGEEGPLNMARSETAVVGGNSTFEKNQTAFRFDQEWAISEMLPAAAVVFKTAAS